jgi:predicted CXXCH cytochrome family protein
MEAFGGGPAGSTMIGTLPGNGDLGIILSNDHPVGFDYEASATADPTGIRLSTAAGVTGTIAEDMLFGAGSDRMECASCHDVHDNSVVGQQPFLIKTNIGSALCTTCHIK